MVFSRKAFFPATFKMWLESGALLPFLVPRWRRERVNPDPTEGAAAEGTQAPSYFVPWTLSAEHNCQNNVFKCFKHRGNQTH